MAGSGATVSEYAYDLDRALTGITRPDLAVVTLGYDPAKGRLTSVTHAHGGVSIGYDPAGRVSSLVESGTQSLAFTYDGFLPLSETWAGPVAGSVSRTFDDDFQIATASPTHGSNLADRRSK